MRTHSELPKRMRIKVVLFLVLLSGLVFLCFRKPSAPDNPQAKESPQPEPSLPSVAAIANHDESEHQHQPATPKAALPAPSPEELWQRPVTEPAFAAFKEWTKRHESAASVQAKEALVDEGVSLGRARL